MTDTPFEHSENARPAASKDDVANASPQADVLEGLLDEFQWAVRQFERAVPYELRYHREDVADCYTALIAHVRAVERERDHLRREVEHFKSSGIVEVAVRNKSVADYMNHWEGRAVNAEVELAATKEALRVAGEERDSWKDETESWENGAEAIALKSVFEQERTWRFELEQERDALRAELSTIKAQAEDATEYVLATINRELDACAEAIRALDATESRKESLRINTQEPTQGK